MKRIRKFFFLLKKECYWFIVIYQNILGSTIQVFSIFLDNRMFIIHPRKSEEKVFFLFLLLLFIVTRIPVQARILMDYIGLNRSISKCQTLKAFRLACQSFIFANLNDLQMPINFNHCTVNYQSFFVTVIIIPFVKK